MYGFVFRTPGAKSESYLIKNCITSNQQFEYVHHLHYKHIVYMYERALYTYNYTNENHLFFFPEVIV